MRSKSFHFFVASGFIHGSLLFLLFDNSFYQRSFRSAVTSNWISLAVLKQQTNRESVSIANKTRIQNQQAKEETSGDRLSLSQNSGSLDSKNENVVLQKYPVQYPPVAKMKKISGTVIAKLQIDQQGRVEKVEVVQASSALFTQEALRALHQYLFSAAVAGKSILYQLDFVLD